MTEGHNDEAKTEGAAEQPWSSAVDELREGLAYAHANLKEHIAKSERSERHFKAKIEKLQTKLARVKDAGKEQAIVVDGLMAQVDKVARYANR